MRCDLYLLVFYNSSKQFQNNNSKKTNHLIFRYQFQVEIVPLRDEEKNTKLAFEINDVTQFKFTA